MIKRNEKHIYVKNLRHVDYELKKEISVNIKTDKDTAIASYEELGTFGLGTTENDAVNDLVNELCNIYRDIEKSPAPLGLTASNWWFHLRSIIKKKANA